MAGRNHHQGLSVLEEIDQAERRRAAAVMQDSAFQDWVKSFRAKFIVNGFLKPVYALGGRFSIADHRVKQFGDYILPGDMAGKVFHEAPKAWIAVEDNWFWWYLTQGQEMTPMNISVPELYRIPGIPAKTVWQEITAITKKLNLFAEAGGGILVGPNELEDGYLAQNDIGTGRDEGEDGYLEEYPLPTVPRWVNIYRQYDKGEADLPLEVRPAWYHLLKYTFFNLSIQKLPVFSLVVNARGQINRISFPDSELTNLSNIAQEYIGEWLLKLPGQNKKSLRVLLYQKTTERDDMVALGQCRSPAEGKGDDLWGNSRSGWKIPEQY